MWVNLHGHLHPSIVKRIKDQLEFIDHVIFADFTHLPAVELASRLLEIVPGNMSKVFFSDNGSTAVEVAIKMALQYWAHKNPTKTKVVCFRGSYHGDTFGAMSVAGKNMFNRPFWSYLFKVESIDPPLKGNEELSLEQLKKLLKQEDVGCFIFEPLVLAAGGMKIYSPTALNELLRECQKHDVITIADEVMTGFGRVGPLFASELLKATSAHLAFCATWKNHPKLVRCEALGTLLVFEIRVKSPSYFHSLKTLLTPFFLDKGVLLRPIGNVVYVLPPYCITTDELQKIYTALASALETM